MTTPTAYRIPKKSLNANKPSQKDKRIWEKHRRKKNKPVKLPKLKN